MELELEWEVMMETVERPFGHSVVRIYPSALDGFEYYTSEDRTEEDLEAYVMELTRQTPPSLEMELGTRFHTGMENLALGKPWGQPDITWDIDVELRQPWKTEEPLKLSRYHEIDPEGNTIVLSGKIDALYNNPPTIVDYKTTGKSINLEKYSDSWQWRAYLLMWPQYDHFRYDAFQLKKKRGKQEWSVSDHRPLELQRYDGMAEETWAMVDRFAEFLIKLHETGRLVIDGNGRLKPRAKPVDENAPAAVSY